MKYCILPVEHWAAEHRASASRKWCPSLIWTFPSSCPVQHFHLYSYKQSDLFTAFILSTGFNIFIGLVDAVLLGAADLIHLRIFINFTMHNQSWMRNLSIALSQYFILHYVIIIRFVMHHLSFYQSIFAINIVLMLFAIFCLIFLQTVMTFPCSSIQLAARGCSHPSLASAVPSI